MQLILCKADVANQPLNQSVIFLKDGELILTSDTWNVIVQFDLNPFEEAVAVLHEELTDIHNITNRSLQFDEVKRVQEVLQILENKLTNVKHFLPKPARKRGLLNIGGNLLRILFGTATVAEITNLHSTVDTLRNNQQTIAHSVNQQVTLVKQLDGIVRHNQDSLTNLTFIIKDYVLKVQDKFQNLVSKLEWITKQQEVNTAVRKLEFFVTQLQIQVDELVSAFQVLQMGRLPLNLITFAQLEAILRNVTLTLPPGSELIMGSHHHHIPWYIANVKATMLADYHSFMLMLSLPLSVSDRKFEVFRTHSFPMQITNGTYLRYHFNDGYLATNGFHHTYFTLTELEFSQCQGDTIKVCSANKPVRNRNNDQIACEMQLYLRVDASSGSCKRFVTVETPFPEMQRHGTAILYYMPNPTQAFLRCRNGPDWNTSSLVLQGAGILENVLSCHVTAGNLHLYARLSGESKVQTQTLEIIIPSHRMLAAPEELEALRNFSSDQVTYKMLSTLTAYKMEPSVENLLTLHSAMTTPTNSFDWMHHLIISATVSVISIIIYHCSSALLRKLRHCTSRRKSAESRPNTTSAPDLPTPQPRAAPASNPAPAQPGAECTSEGHNTTPHAVYAFQSHASQ
jgi:hypothetical protein